MKSAGPLEGRDALGGIDGLRNDHARYPYTISTFIPGVHDTLKTQFDLDHRTAHIHHTAQQYCEVFQYCDTLSAPKVFHFDGNGMRDWVDVSLLIFAAVSITDRAVSN
jgi:hypothetical protein